MEQSPSTDTRTISPRWIVRRGFILDLSHRGHINIMFATTITDTTEIRRHNGQNPYGPWLPLCDADIWIRDAIVDEIIECTTNDMRHAPGANTDDRGKLTIGGEIWIYRR